MLTTYCDGRHSRPIDHKTETRLVKLTADSPTGVDRYAYLCIPCFGKGC